MEYQKINSIYKRDERGKFTVVYSMPELVLLKNANWWWDEKIDGTNIRVTWDCQQHTVNFGGRTDNAQIPTQLLSVLMEKFTVDRFKKCELPSMTLYGEGYGAKIQKGGGNYRAAGCDFILFDVFCGGLWLRRDSVQDIAINLFTDLVPQIGETFGLLEIEPVNRRTKPTIYTSHTVHVRQCELIERAAEKTKTYVQTVIWDFGATKETSKYVLLTPEIEACLKKAGLL